ncbi:MAG: hypothetical protein ABIH70_00595 [Chloroflexota bacterium]
MVKIRIIACWALLGIMFGLVLIIISPLRGLLQIPGDLSNYVIHLGVLGVSLVILAMITRMSRVLRDFLITAGASALGWPISLYLHDLLVRFFPTEPITYILVFFVLPVTFLAGVLGAIVIGIIQLVSSR